MIISKRTYIAVPEHSMHSDRALMLIRYVFMKVQDKAYFTCELAVAIQNAIQQCPERSSRSVHDLYTLNLLTITKVCQTNHCLGETKESTSSATMALEMP